MTRIRTGIARRPDGPEDANPMNRRLPAEVVSRRKGENRAHPGKGVKEEVAPSHLSTDLKQVLAMKPEARSKWLTKAVQQAHPQDGRLSPKSIYDIIAHAKFANDLSEKIGQRMYRVLHASLSLFSTKQQKFLEKDCALAKQFATAAFAPQPGAEEEDTTAVDAMEDMMARCRAFVRERQSERGERNAQEGEDAEAAPEVPQAAQVPDAKQATQDEAAELRQANAEATSEQLTLQAAPQKEVEANGHLTRASKSRSRSRSSPSKTRGQEATGSPEKERDGKHAKDEASKPKKASKQESKENGKGKTSEKPRTKESKETKDPKASEAKKSKDEASRDGKTKGTKDSKDKAKESRKRESNRRRGSSSSRSGRRRVRDDSESSGSRSRSRRNSDKRRGKKSRSSSDSSSFVSRKRGRSSSSRPKRRR